MTYEEAINERELRYGATDYITREFGLPKYAIIAPENPEDFIKFYRVFEKDFNLYNDTLCLEYSTNNSYTIRYQMVVKYLGL